MSKYKEWYDKQSEEFKNEVNPSQTLIERFIDYNLRPITLDDLANLDENYCVVKPDMQELNQDVAKIVKKA